MSKHCSTDVRLTHEERVLVCNRPSLGLTLIFATFGFGTDRFYVGQVGVGIALLIGYLTGLGAIVAIPVEWLSALSLVVAILSGRTRAFMYGDGVMFEKPTLFDRVIAVLWILLLVLFLAGIVILVLTFRQWASRAINPPP